MAKDKNEKTVEVAKVSIEDVKSAYSILENKVNLYLAEKTIPYEDREKLGNAVDKYAFSIGLKNTLFGTTNKGKNKTESVSPLAKRGITS